MKPTTAISIAILAVTGALVFFAVRKGTQFAKAINPLSNENAIAQGFDEIITLGQADEGFSLGSWLFDLVNPEFDPNAPQEVSEETLQFIDLASIPRKRGTVILTPPTA